MALGRRLPEPRPLLLVQRLEGLMLGPSLNLFTFGRETGSLSSGLLVLGILLLDGASLLQVLGPVWFLPW